MLVGNIETGWQTDGRKFKYNFIHKTKNLNGECLMCVFRLTILIIKFFFESVSV